MTRASQLEVECLVSDLGEIKQPASIGTDEERIFDSALPETVRVS